MSKVTAISHDAVTVVIKVSAPLRLISHIDTTLLSLLLLRLLGLILIVGLVTSSIHHGHPLGLHHILSHHLVLICQRLVLGLLDHLSRVHLLGLCLLLLLLLLLLRLYLLVHLLWHLLLVNLLLLLHL